MGTLTNVTWETNRPGRWIIEAWQNKAGRYGSLFSLLFLMALYIFVGIRFRVKDTISLTFSPQGEPLEEISATNMLVVPLAATIIWVIGTVMGLILFQKQKNRPVSALIWGSLPFAVLQCLAAAIMNF